MQPSSKRYRAFISYSQRDKSFARRLHRALETYRVPAGINAQGLGQKRTLGRFFRDDDEMGASQSLGAALEGALDDAENLIVVCTPASARSTWVDAEVRRFKRRGSAGVFAVIAGGAPNAGDPARECFPPSLKVRIDAAGRPTGEPDEPRAPDLEREGFARIRAQLAAGLLGVPFDDLWQRDRRRARRNQLLGALAVLAIAGVLGSFGYGWLGAQRDARIQAANDAITQSRSAAADGRISEALTRLAPFLTHRETATLVEGPLRTLLGWVPDSYDAATTVSTRGLNAARLRDATVLLDSGKGVYDVSDVGLRLERLIRSRDGRRVIAIGEQRAVVLDAASGQRLAQVDNARASWHGHAFEAPSGLIVVTGGLLGPTNGSTVPLLLTFSADGKSARRNEIGGMLVWDSIAVTPACDALVVASTGGSDGVNATTSYSLDASGLGEPRRVRPGQRTGGAQPASAGTALAPFGAALAMVDVFLGKVAGNPFSATACQPLAVDDGFVAGHGVPRGAAVLPLEPTLSFETPDRWTPTTPPASPPSEATYRPDCTEAKPCPVIGGRTADTFIRNDHAVEGDEIGAPPAPRWQRAAATHSATAATPMPSGTSAGVPIYFEHRRYNAAHTLVVCRKRDGRDACLSIDSLGEDQFEQPFLRSPDRRYLYWPFAGTVYDLDALRPVTDAKAIPQTEAALYDFDVDRAALTFVDDGRLVSFGAPTERAGSWARNDDQRASPRFGILTVEAGDPPLLALVSLGTRQYMAVRRDGVVTRLDAASGRELWRITATGLGEIAAVRLNPERTHALLLGRTAWRMFRLADGFAESGLLAVPETAAGRTLRREADKVAVQSASAANAAVMAGRQDRFAEQARAAKLATAAAALACEPIDALGANGTLLARCGRRTFAWQPREFSGELAPKLARLTCAADVKTSAIETIRRCYVNVR